MNAPFTGRTPDGALVIRQIVAALSLSPRSEATARYALGIAKAFGAPRCSGNR
jgi:hypothetical protein